MAILFVCLGNICRSPSAQAVARVLAPDRAWDSAGTGGWHVGNPPHPPMIAAAQARGYAMADLRARQVSAQDFARFDRIIVMDRQNARDVARLRPRDNATPVQLLLAFAGAGAPHDVPDPYYTGDYAQALDLIEAGVRGLLADL